jgi:hypothetical protein
MAWEARSGLKPLLSIIDAVHFLWETVPTLP